MKARIVHETKGRLRLRLITPARMSVAEADILEGYLKAVPGVRQAAVHERSSCAVVFFDGDRKSVTDAVSSFDFGLPGIDNYMPPYSTRAFNEEYEERLVVKTASHYLAKLFLPVPLRMAATVLRAIPYFSKGLSCVGEGRLGAELLDALSIGVSMARGDFDTAGSVAFLLGAGELLEEWTHKKSVSDLAGSMALNVDKVWLVGESEDILTPIAKVRIGDLVKVAAGGIVPLDGEVYEGEALVNEASLTGESIPRAKRPGKQVYAGTVLEEGSLIVKVLKQQDESKYSKIVSMIENSEQWKSSAEKRAGFLADRLVPYTLAGSICTYLLTRNATRAVSLLMVDFSCALKLATPLAVLSAMQKAGREGITVKGGKFLENYASADTIVFDKTGTLTHACPVVAKVITFGGHDEKEMLKVAACLEEHFPHSMANAVVKAASDEKLEHEEMHSEVEYLVAHGIKTAIKKEKVIIGSRHFVFEDMGCSVPAGEELKFENLPPEYSHLYLAIAEELAAVICIHDPLRNEAKAVLDRLRRLGVGRLVMLTGDSFRTAEAIAKEVGVDDFRAEVLPEDKARFVDEERLLGHTVVMIGDGINDSPALSAADVGIAIGDGAAIAREIADITIEAESLYELVTLRFVSMSLMKRIASNYRFIMGFNSFLMACGALGVLSPSLSALFHNMSTIAVGLKSMTPLSYPAVEEKAGL